MKVSFCAVEVGARGYAAESLLSCLRCLGFPSKLCRSTIKNISTTCLKCSFDIWMVRNFSSWKLEGPCKSPSDVSSGPAATTSASSKSIHLSTSKTASFPPETRKVDHPKTVKASQKKVNVNHFRCGLFNKGNTCYVNVILQALRPLSSLWSDKYAVTVICTPYLDVPVRVDDEVSCVRKFALVSGICHSDSLRSGHYTAFARDDVCGGWLHLNDKAVTKTTLEALNDPLPCVLFYQAC